MCGIYQGDALSPLLFCITLNPPSKIINKAGYRYTLQNIANISHLLYIYVFKLYARGKRDIDSFIHMIRIYSKDSGVSFRLEKCSRKQGMWQTESGPRSRTWSHSFICWLQAETTKHKAEHTNWKTKGWRTNGRPHNMREKTDWWKPHTQWGRTQQWTERWTIFT